MTAPVEQEFSAMAWNFILGGHPPAAPFFEQ